MASQESLRRIFIGSIPETVAESEIRAAGSKYGSITAFHYVPSSRGWALITYSTPDEAALAIEGMNGKMLFSKCQSPIAVRIAHEKKGEASSQRSGASTASAATSSTNVVAAGITGPSANSVAANGPIMYTSDGQCFGMDFMCSSNFLAAAAAAAAKRYNGAFTQSQNQGQVSNALFNPMTLGYDPAAGSVIPSPWFTYYTHEGLPYYFNFITKQTQWEKPADLPPQPYPTQQRPQQIGVPFVANGGKPYNEALGARRFGPPGCNLFVFHIPSEWGHAELYDHFKHFGKIISARVKTDGAGRNLGFGFVSFEKPEQAQAAIRAMHGFNVGGKWLKVTLKKGEEHLLPPSMQNIYTRSTTRRPSTGVPNGGTVPSNSTSTPVSPVNSNSTLQSEAIKTETTESSTPSSSSPASNLKEEAQLAKAKGEETEPASTSASTMQSEAPRPIKLEV